MNETQNSPVCERASELIAFVYNETNESEAREFELHLKECCDCREDVASFGLVRESIVAWRDAALTGFIAPPSTAIARKKSAIAAFRQFFDLSPFWLKAATGFAVLSFCVLAVLVFTKTETTAPVVNVSNSDKIYSEHNVPPIVKEASVREEQPVKSPRITRKKVDVRSRRPLSRSERDQLAADLRLLSSADDSLNLLSDRINQ